MNAVVGSTSQQTQFAQSATKLATNWSIAVSVGRTVTGTFIRPNINGIPAINPGQYRPTSAKVNQRSPQLRNPDPIDLRSLLGRFLAAVQRLGDFFQTLTLAREGAQFADFFGFPGLAVFGDRKSVV